MPRIRPARDTDAPRLPDIERSAGLAFLRIPDLAWIACDTVQTVAEHRTFIRQGLCWVAVDAADAPLGFLNAEKADTALHLWELAVRHDRQRQGIGTALVATARENARAWGLAAVTLTTFREVAWNEGFYQKLGFRTLAQNALGPRLETILAAEAARGLPRDRRCAMRLALREGKGHRRGISRACTGRD